MSEKDCHTLKTRLIELLCQRELWLMERVLGYARKYQYTRYTSTLAEAWRISIHELTQAISGCLIRFPGLIELNASQDYLNSPFRKFCGDIVQSHRQRGISPELFLGLFKYYRRAYYDCVQESSWEPGDKTWCLDWLGSFFDQMEIAIFANWHVSTAEIKLQALETYNRNITNEKNKYLNLFESLPQPVFILDNDNRIIHMNHAAITIYKSRALPGDSYYHDSHIGESLPWLQAELEQMQKENRVSVKFEKKYENGPAYTWYECTLTRLSNAINQNLGIMIVLNDITQRKHSEETLRNLSVEDDLTGLFNRRGFLWLAHRQLKLSRRMNKRAVLFYLDVDYLKAVNDKYGHPEGDLYLQAMAKLLKDSFRESDIIGRIGGDEFLVLALDVQPGCENMLHNRLIENMKVFNQQSHFPLPLSASVGFVSYNADKDLPIEDLISEADARMYEEKRLRRELLDTFH
jgi:diguanylate cyclase (GGDEF)-like protein/PAS domain S-box-containing protein